MRRRLSYEKFVQCRTNSLIYIFAFFYLLLVCRLFYIQVWCGPAFKERADALTVRKIPLPARRGTIYDRFGNKLAVSVDAYDIAARPAAIKHKVVTAKMLAPLIGWDSDKLLEEFRTRKKFFYLARRADFEAGTKIKDAKLLGIDVISTSKRIYPAGSMAAHVIGFTRVDGVGLEGVEKAYDEILRGKDGYWIAERDARGVVIPGTKKERVEPDNGKDIVLTIDSTLQHTLEEGLKETIKNFSPVGASAVVMDPKTGEILALANIPTFDPNDQSSSKPNAKRNRAVTDLYEPGSTLKAITACAALESKAVSLTQTFSCTGKRKIGRRTIRCSLHGREFRYGHGSCNVGKMLKYSCNIAAAGMGFKIGKEGLYNFEKAFGLYEKPGSGLVGESAGWPDPWEKWADIHLANVAFGQGIAITPMQMAKAYSAIANGGSLMQPLIIKEIRNVDGTSVKAFGPTVIRRVISPETSHAVANMLGGVVDEGTGKNAGVEGYNVAGKTGSAEKASTTGRGYVDGKYIASFAGFLPIRDPRVVILVAVDEPKGSHFGATVAAPVFQKVAKKAMWHMRVPPDNKPGNPSPAAGGINNHNVDDADSDEDHPRLGG
ncbi:MAG: peptidoglycan D,D-transpeptidase FtsI family protein [Armatimonadota bacterium]